MKSNPRISAAVRVALGVTAGFIVLGSASSALAQDDDASLEEITVTGTRIKVPGIVSSSPIYSIGEGEIQLQAQPEVERILRLLPVTKPDDGQNVNNGSDGAATIDLRGLGEERNLILIDGKRATPYSIAGLVDTQTIPTALIERIDIITGGASAVYGSDAIAGALNFVMKKDFEGIDLRYNHTVTDENDGVTQSASMTMGTNMADGRGNAVLAASTYSHALQVAPPENHRPKQLRAELMHARSFVDRHTNGLLDHLTNKMSALQKDADKADAARWGEAISIRAGETRPYVSNSNQLYIPRLPAIPFFERSTFPFLAELEAGTAVSASRTISHAARRQQKYWKILRSAI